jgi:hypothetical protein
MAILGEILMGRRIAEAARDRTPQSTNDPEIPTKWGRGGGTKPAAPWLVAARPRRSVLRRSGDERGAGRR